MFRRLICLATLVLMLGVAGDCYADLIAHLGFDEGSGNVAHDTSGNGYDGTLNGNPQWVAGHIGGAFEFDGIDDYVEIPRIVQDDFTLAAWARLAPDSAGNYGGIAGKLRDSSSYMGFSLVRHSTNDYRLWVGDGTTALTPSGVSSDELYMDTEWPHVAGVREGHLQRSRRLEDLRDVGELGAGGLERPEHLGNPRDGEVDVAGHEGVLRDDVRTLGRHGGRGAGPGQALPGAPAGGGAAGNWRRMGRSQVGYPVRYPKWLCEQPIR